MRWYLRYQLSYHKLEEIKLERGVDRTTIYKIHPSAPEFEKRLRYYSKIYLRWRVDETFIKVKEKWKYLYRAVDTIDFMLTHRRDIKTTEKFFKKALRRTSIEPYTINTDQLATYKPACYI